MNKTDTLKSQIESLVAYMRIKIDQADWHAVADAAMDIRELEAKIKVYEENKIWIVPASSGE
jgi:hypothetical protein